MIFTQAKMEKVVQFTEEEEIDKLESDIGKEAEENEDDIEESEKDEEERGGDDEDLEVEQQADDEAIPKPTEVKTDKQPDVLNLNNEVVKMRKEVKRVRALIIRKLTRQIAALKKKKGKETEVERNQKRAARLLEEVHALKELVPDMVTKTALQRSFNFDKVCKNPKSTISDRAVARLATHPQFNKKITDIKAAIKAFKDERMKGGRLVEKEKVQTQQVEEVTLPAPNKGEQKSEAKGEDKTPKTKKVIVSEAEVICKDTEKVTAVTNEKEMDKETDANVTPVDKLPESESVKQAVVKKTDVKETEKIGIPSKVIGKKFKLISVPTSLQSKSDEKESELELSDSEGKEYFDDSTEERFHKQSSQSEESDEDDFFVGKVSKFKKKKKSKDGEEKKEDLKKDPTDNGKPVDKLQSQLDELESRLKSKANPLQTVFCPSLLGTKPASRGKGGDKFMGKGKTQGPNKDFSKQSKFQKQENSVSKYSKPFPEGSQKDFGSAGRGRGRGRGRGDAHRQKDPRARGGGFTQQPAQQALHPSWEASKKRKEQQGQILAFQGKKIKFDDDD